MPRICVACQSELPAGARRCDSCGTLQPFDPPRRLPSQSSEAAPPDRRALLVKILIGVLVFALIGLGGATALLIVQSRAAPQKQAAAPTSTPGSSSSPTQAPAPSATATANTASTSSALGGAPLTIKALGIVDYIPKVLLPDTLPLKPLPVSQAKGPTNITFGNSITMSVSVKIPPAPQVGIVCKLSIRMVAFQPLAGSVNNVWGSCDEYENPGGPAGGGCGGGFTTEGTATGTFPSAQVGTTLTPTVIGASDTQPAKISTTSEGEGIVAVDLQLPAPGTYTFQVGLWQDTSGPKWSNLTLRQMVLFGHINHLWSGQACTASDMQAQLPPPTDPPEVFICPGGPPQP